MSLHDAARSGDLDQVQTLVESGAALNAKDKFGRMPLHWAAFRGHEAVVEYLVGHEADMEAMDNFRRTPLHWAASRGHAAVVEYLVCHGADMEAKDVRGDTPYDVAVGWQVPRAVADFFDSVKAMGGYAAYRVDSNWKRRSLLVKWRMAFVGPL